MRPGYSGLLDLDEHQKERIQLIVKLIDFWEKLCDQGVDSTETLDARAPEDEAWPAYVPWADDPKLERFKMDCGCLKTTSSRRSGRIPICGSSNYRCPVCKGTTVLVGRPESYYALRARQEGPTFTNEDAPAPVPPRIDKETWESGSFAELERAMAEFERWKLKIDRPDLQICDPIGLLFLEKRMPANIQVPYIRTYYAEVMAFGNAIVARGNKADPKLIARRDWFIRRLAEYPTVTHVQLAEMLDMDERQIRNILNGRSDRGRKRLSLPKERWWNRGDKREFWRYIKQRSQVERSIAFKNAWKAAMKALEASPLYARLR